MSKIKHIEHAEHDFFLKAGSHLADIFELSDAFLALFEAFCEQIDFEKLQVAEGQEQAFNNCLRNIQKCFIGSTLSILRGDPLNSYSTSRKAIESCVFAFEILINPKSAKAYTNSFANETATKDYMEQFKIYKLVTKTHKERLGEQLSRRYDSYCMAVHPSALTALQHSLFSSVALEPHEEPSVKTITYLVAEFFGVLADSACIVDRLAALLSKQSQFKGTGVFRQQCLRFIELQENKKASWSDRIKQLDPREGD